MPTDKPASPKPGHERAPAERTQLPAPDALPGSFPNEDESGERMPHRDPRPDAPARRQTLRDDR